MTSISKKPYIFVIFLGGGSGPPVPPPSGSAHGEVDIKQYKIKKDGKDQKSIQSSMIPNGKLTKPPKSVIISFSIKMKRFLSPNLVCLTFISNQRFKEVQIFDVLPF